MTHYQETPYGFEFGSASVTRTCSDDRRGWVVVTCKTPRVSCDLYVTKTGKLRVYVDGKELGTMEG